MSTDGFQHAPTPHLDQLVKNGALSLHTRNVMPTVSGPCWGAILLGAGPEHTGIVDNNWSPHQHEIPPLQADEKGFFPSIFSEIHQQLPDAHTAMFYDWAGLTNFINTDFIDTIALLQGYHKVYQTAIPYFLKHQPDLSFIYVGHPDEAGHQYGHGSPEYYHSITAVDSLVGVLVAHLKENQLYANTTLVVVSDHGGIGYGHGGNSLAELEIPWIISGPATLKNRLIEQANDLYNTPPTLARLLGMKPHPAWEGTIVNGAFKGTEEAQKNIHAYVPKPYANVKSGIYFDPLEVQLRVNDPSAKIHYTLNSSRPNANSAIYSTPLQLKHSCTLQAISVAADQNSQLLKIEMIRSRKVKRPRLITTPASKYTGCGASGLFDGLRGSGSYTHKQWNGFSGDDLVVDFQTQSNQPIQQLAISCLNQNHSWIFLPTAITLLGSEDGKTFQPIKHWETSIIDRQATEGPCILTFNGPASIAPYLRLHIANQGICPQGHPGAGEKAWLFVDEIIVN